VIDHTIFRSLRHAGAGELLVEGTGSDVGNAVVYLAGDQARWVTGVVLPVDAGTIARSVQPPKL
jgi:NAD(P)-dependent dehydrogenase (short-subunit alcohol dehydrogenase family)